LSHKLPLAGDDGVFVPTETVTLPPEPTPTPEATALAKKSELVILIRSALARLRPPELNPSYNLKVFAV